MWSSTCPIGLLLEIASYLPRARDLDALVCTSRGSYQALDKRLYDSKVNAEVFASEIKKGRDMAVKRLLKEFLLRRRERVEAGRPYALHV